MLLSYLDVPIGWAEVLRRTARETLKDDAQGLAAQLAYYFFLSLFPALLCLVALASLFPLEHLTDELIRVLSPVAPIEVIGIIRDQMLKISSGGHIGLLSLGLAGALWSSSSAMGAVVNAMNRAYDIDDSRRWWKVRGIALLLTVGLAFFILFSLTLVLAGPELADAFTRWFGMATVFAWTWKIVQWPFVYGLVSTGIGLVYYFAPDAEQEWVWITPGSVLASALWLVGSLGFRWYVVRFGDYVGTYGAIGAMIVLLLWFYLTGLAIVIGAEMNAEIEHASPWGKKPGEKIPGEKRRIGAAAAREYRARGRGQDAPAL